MRNLVIGQRQTAPYFSAFHWSPHGCLICIGQHFVTTRVVHLPKRTKTSLITESDQSRANHQLLQLCMVRTAWSDSDQAVRAVHSCKSWFQTISSKIRGYFELSVFHSQLYTLIFKLWSLELNIYKLQSPEFTAYFSKWVHKIRTPLTINQVYFNHMTMRQVFTPVIRFQISKSVVCNSALK